MVGRSNSAGHGHLQSPASPQSNGLPSPAETANASFPLNDIDYESSPAAVAQELSNLQAIRRMSMDVNVAGDPDLPSFNPAFGMPTVAPTGAADEDDTSRLFWVPARLHPELAPQEFKTFLDNRVESIKRRSVDFSLSPDGPSRSSSGGGLRRKKSMLSRQIDNSEGRGADGYQDGAERLDRKRSRSGKDATSPGMANLQELEVLVNDPSQVIQRLSLDAEQRAAIMEGSNHEDLPILPAAPGGNSLRRSTRTTYRRGSLRKGERLPPSKRAAKLSESDTESSVPMSPTLPDANDPPFQPLSRVQTEPPPSLEKVPERLPPENFSRPGRLNRNRSAAPPVSTTIAPSSSLDSLAKSPTKSPTSPPFEGNNRSSMTPSLQSPPLTSREPKPFVSQIASNGRSTVQLYNKVPAIVETPPQDDGRANHQQPYRPERVSSHDPPSGYGPQSASRGGMQPMRGAKRSPVGRPIQQNDQTDQTLQHMAAHPSPLPGNSTRTDSLSFIPTLTEEKKTDSKKDGTKKSSWSWGSLLGTEEKEKERRKEEEAKEASKRAKSKSPKPNDNTRLDLLQTTAAMDGTRGRESLILERPTDSKLEEERKKESSRKSSESRKEKDSGLFSSLFGGKRKPDRESTGKKSLRPLSPEPPRPLPKPDIDYNWTRFSILEERAIYRMAHIKLANPRRALYSQVLLSNFMYSYLAKVQQMHPQIQIPQNAAQKAQQRAQQQQQQQQKKADQPEEFYQYQRYQEVSIVRIVSFIQSDVVQQQQLQDQQQAQQQAQQLQPHHQQQEGTHYEETQNYNYDYDDPDDRHRPQSRASSHAIENESNGAFNHEYGYQNQQQSQHSAYQYQQSQFEDPDRGEDDDMW